MTQPASKRLLTEAAAAAQASDNATPLGAALSATYVRFEDEAGNPLPNRNVVIKVSATTGEIIDIVSEA
ncbi:hypothetical protein J2X12_002902 [Pseudarthrobacter oxydans]|uniref:PepSY domain-containing protein n=1 Tax=Pseudarthrobacter oxydans TaxID=1671 RepID=A0AAW8NEQ0_PSEOX|nr:hypothetical protein [Pseudarthrobacter oxydans]MDR6794361.1 hypothetical protein [Pseudarthrobacter oxydans]MDR7164864.1 hypothetical protein [Pseudarthrobacter oxydans]